MALHIIIIIIIIANTAHIMSIKNTTIKNDTSSNIMIGITKSWP